MPGDHQNNAGATTMTFGSGGTISGSVYLNGEALFAIASSGTWTNSALTFEVTTSPDTPGPGSWLRMFSGAALVSVPVVTSGSSIFYIGTLLPAPVPIQWIRGWSGTAQVNGTAQAANRTLTLLTRPI